MLFVLVCNPQSVLCPKKPHILLGWWSILNVQGVPKQNGSNTVNLVLCVSRHIVSLWAPSDRSSTTSKHGIVSVNILTLMWIFFWNKTFQYDIWCVVWNWTIDVPQWMHWQGQHHHMTTLIYVYSTSRWLLCLLVFRIASTHSWTENMYSTTNCKIFKYFMFYIMFFSHKKQVIRHIPHQTNKMLCLFPFFQLKYSIQKKYETSQNPHIIIAYGGVPLCPMSTLQSDWLHW